MHQRMSTIFLTIHWSCGEFRANTLENASLCLRIRKVQERSCCISPQPPDFSRFLISAGHITFCQSYFPHISRSLAKQAASNCCREADALLSHHPIQNRRAKGGKQQHKTCKQKERELRRAKHNNKQDMKVSQSIRETHDLSLFKLKVSCFH